MYEVYVYENLEIFMKILKDSYAHSRAAHRMHARKLPRRGTRVCRVAVCGRAWRRKPRPPELLRPHQPPSHSKPLAL